MSTFSAERPHWDKAVLRRDLRARRRDFSRADQDRAAASIARILAAEVPAEGLVAGYAPMPGEPDVWPFLTYHGTGGGSVLLPITPHDPDDRQLRWGAWAPGDALSDHGRLPIRQPHPPAGGALSTGEVRARAVAGAVPLVVLVPCLAVDAEGFRLGQGGGYYDSAWGPQAAELPQPGTLFAPRAGDTRLIGVVYTHEVLPAGTFRAEEHDLRLTEIVTDSGVLRL